MSPFSNARSIYFATNSLVVLLDVASSRRRQLAVSCVAHVSVITISRYIGLTFINARVHASVYLSRGSVGCPFTGSLMLRYARTSERGNRRAGGRTSAVLFTCSFTTRPFHVCTRYRSPTSCFYFILAPTSSILDSIEHVNKSSKCERGYDQNSLHVAYSPQTYTTLTKQYIRIVDNQKIDKGNRLSRNFWEVFKNALGAIWDNNK